MYYASACQQMDGYKHSGGYCYFTPSNCSSSNNTLLYISCQCYWY